MAHEPPDAGPRRADELLKRSAALDAARPAADLDNPRLVAALLRLFHGGAAQLAYPSASSAPAAPAPAPVASAPAHGTGGSSAAGGGSPSEGAGVALLAAAAPSDAASVAAAAGPALRSRIVGVLCRWGQSQPAGCVWALVG